MGNLVTLYKDRIKPKYYTNIWDAPTLSIFHAIYEKG